MHPAYNIQFLVLTGLDLFSQKYRTGIELLRIEFWKWKFIVNYLKAMNFCTALSGTTNLRQFDNICEKVKNNSCNVWKRAIKHLESCFPSHTTISNNVSPNLKSSKLNAKLTNAPIFYLRIIRFKNVCKMLQLIYKHYLH